MREIEFRVHCDDSGEILAYEYFNTFLNWGYFWTDPNERGDNAICHAPPEYFKHPHCLGKLNRVLFTGLKDKNRVKIFEGDIVSVRYCDDDDDDDDDVSIGKVAWMDCYYPAFDIYVPSDRAASGFEPYHDEFNSFSCPDFIIQVIGNIYQNPELLEA